MKITLLFFTSLITFFSSIAQNEQMAFKSLTTNMGLSHGDVLCFYQDHEGYMWIGTTDGLNKYDGVGFTVYKNKKNDTTSLSSNYIICIYEDKQNNLWIGLPDGLCRYNRDKDNFEKISFNDNHIIKFKRSINVIFEDNNKNLWIGTSHGLFLLDRERKKFTVCFEEIYDNESLSNCSDICQDKHGILWFSFKDWLKAGLLKYDSYSKVTTLYNNQNKEYNLKENSINCLMIDNQDNLWIGYSSSGIDVLNGQTKTITSYQHINNNPKSLGNNNIFSIIQNKYGKILIGTNGGGISVFNPKTKLFCQYITSESSQLLLTNVIQKLYISRDGIVWIGCWEGGVNISDKRFDRFTLYSQNKQDENSLWGKIVTSFTQDLNGNIWVATDGGGINLFNPSKRKFIRFKSDSKNNQTLTNDKVLALDTDNKDGLWAGMWQGGLNYFKIDGEKLILKKKYNFLDENDKNSNSIFKIYIDNNKELWVGNFASGAYKFDSSTEKFKPVKLPIETQGYNTIRDILCDSYNNVWIATDVNGLIKMNLESGEFERILHNDKDSASLVNNSINVVFEDSKKRLWVSCDGGGLNLFNRKTKSFTHYTTEQGLPDNTIEGILEDSHGNLWISSHLGITKATIDSVNGKLKITFRNYTVQDGLQGKVFNRSAYFKSRTGEMYFGGLNGFNAFNPDSIKDNSYIPPVHITDFLLFNKPVVIGAKGSPLIKHISQTKKLILNYNQSIFTFRFIALNYIFSEKNQYAYIMEGFEKDWNYVGTKKEATYTNLNPGEYTFKVKASNNDGIWNDTGTSIKIIILPPWWKTWWFIFILLSIIVSLIFLVYYFRVASYRKRQKELTIVVRQRTMELENTNQLLLERQKQIEKQAEELLADSAIQKETNELLKERQMRIEEQSEDIQLINEKLLERQDRIEEQSEELRAHSENLKDINKLLIEKQQLIINQSEQLKATNEELSILNATKDRFFSIIAHDLRNPFNVVSGFSEILLRNFDKLPPEKIRKFHEMIHTSSKSGNNLLENLLQWSRSQTGRISYEPIKLNLLAVAEETIRLLESDAERKHITFQQSIDPHQIVLADENMIKTIFRNLLSNAIKFTGANGKIDLKSKANDQQVEITIADTGVGIPADTISKLFRVDTIVTTKGTSKESGTGLGLLLCKDFVEKQGGKIWVESEVGKGSEFKFTLPLA